MIAQLALVLLGTIEVQDHEQAGGCTGDCETVAYLGDPQIGMSGNVTEDSRRFGLAADASVKASATAVVIAGDLLQDLGGAGYGDEVPAFKSVWPKRFSSAADVHLIPGNHDADCNGKASHYMEDLTHFKQTFTPQDYSTFTTKYASFVLINDETLIINSRNLSRWPTNITSPIAQAAEEQWAFIDRSLSAAQYDERPHTVMVMHHPPFIHTENETAQYFNWPNGPRARLLALVRKYGVRLLLCGHTHTTTEVQTHDNITILTTAGTARAFDKNGCGWRFLRMNATAMDVRYVELPGGGGEGCGAKPSVGSFGAWHWSSFT